MTAMPGLLYVLNHYSAASAGHFGHVIPLLNELSRQGVRIRLLIEKGDGRPDALEEGIDCVVLSPSSAVTRMLGVARSCRRASREGYQRVFVRISLWTAVVALLSTRGTQTRVAFWLSGTTLGFDRAQPRSRRKLVWWFRTRLPYLVVARTVDYFVTGPAPMVGYYASEGGVSRRRLRLLHNDIQVERYARSVEERHQARAAVREKYAVPEGALLLLLVHRLSPVRRTLLYLPGALVRLREEGVLDRCVLLVVGDGGDAGELRRRCVETGVDSAVRFAGALPSVETDDLYVAADVFVQPSHAEGFPRVLLEAMASGLPVVSTDAGGSASVLGSRQQAFVTDADEPADFARALLEMVDARAPREELAAENLERARDFDTPAVAEMYREVLFGDL